jgi:nondiscriminating glutamyl-tRNA synthetase
MTVKARFAPSPTGFIHVGNLRTAIFTYLIAKQKDGIFMLRIEDTDQGRLVEGALDAITDTLTQTGLLWDEGPLKGGPDGPYIQSERLSLYQQYANELIDKGHAYRCFCSEERLNEQREAAQAQKQTYMYDGFCLHLSPEEINQNLAEKKPFVIRQKTPSTGSTRFHCEVYGDITIENELIEDQILLKSDGYPTYNFANVVDDHLMHITHVVRGNEYLTSTPKYTLLYQAFGWQEPTYVHVPLVVKADGKKMSKRDGDAYYSDFVQKGYLPQAIVNYLSLLGWAPTTDQEIYTLDELVKAFDVSRINTSPAVFDVAKLNWINAHFIKALDEASYVERVLPYITENVSKETKVALAKLFQERLDYLSQIQDHIDGFYRPVQDSETKEFMASADHQPVLTTFKKVIESLDDFQPDLIKQAINEAGAQCGVKGKMLFMPIRIQTTGVMHGPDLPRSLAILGKEEVLKRLSDEA